MPVAHTWPSRSQLHFRQRTWRRSLQHVAILNREIALVARAFQALLPGRIDHRARQVRALLTVGNVATLVHPNQEAVVPKPRILKHPRGTNRNLSGPGNRCSWPNGSRRFRQPSFRNQPELSGKMRCCSVFGARVSRTKSYRYFWRVTNSSPLCTALRTKHSATSAPCSPRERA